MQDFTIWYAIKLHCNEETISEITEYLAMNGYTYDTNGEDVLFVYHEEVDYVMTILREHGCPNFVVL